MIVVLLKSDQFWGHPAYGTNLADRASFLLMELCCIAEIGQLDIAFSVDENVVTLDISVDDSTRMQVVEGLKSLPEDVGTYLLVDVASSFLQDLSKVSDVH